MAKYDVYFAQNGGRYEFWGSTEAATAKAAVAKFKRGLSRTEQYTASRGKFKAQRTKSNPGPLKPPKGKWIKATAVKFNRNGTVTVKATGRVRSNPRNGYVVYPDGTGHMKLSAANKAAKAASKREGHARVESVDTQRTISRWVDGKRA